MGVFNYSLFHYFDKHGHELILSHYPDVKFRINNPTHPEFPAEYAVVKSTPDLGNISGNSSLLQISSGMRFGLTEDNKYLDVSTFVNDTSNNIMFGDNAKIINGVAGSGLKISIIGDSISTFNQEGYKIDGYAMYYPRGDVQSPNDTWWMNVINSTHNKLEKNASYSGGTSSTRYHGFAERVDKLGNPDIIFVALGTNDSTRNISIGNFDFESDDLDLTKFAPSYINGIKSIKRLYKNARIICLAFYMKDDYFEAIKIIAKHTGCDFIDLRKYHVDEPFNVHPNKSLMTGAANSIINSLPDIFSKQYRKYNHKEYSSSFGSQNYPELLYNNSSNAVRSNFLDQSNLNLDASVNFFPTYSFKSRIEFDKVSTELIETQTIYVLIENEFVTDNDGKKMLTTVKEYTDLSDTFLSEYEQIISKINDISNRINQINNQIDEINIQIEEEYEEHGIIPCELVIQRDDLISETTSLNNDIIDLNNDAEQKKNDYDKCKDAKDYVSRFNIMFFVDCRDQKDFRFFSTKYDEMSWSDRSFIDFNKKYSIEESENGYSVNVGFSGEYDGVYQQPMYVCLIDTQDKSNSEIGEAYPIGEFMLNAEAEGEDERYRTFFENFGIPDPKEYNNIFSNTDINDDLPDYVSINKNSKKLYLAYSEIFPYIGSYKALINAIRYLGYDDVFFKEWYKEIGNSTFDDSGYTTYEISYGNTSKKNTIENLTVEERIHLRKMNWISMIYRINEELDEPENMYGFPTSITNVKNFNTERLAKLISLKNWIDKYATGVNCRVIDISGEGLVFERYNINKFGSYQRVIEYNNEKAISPVPVNTACSLINGSANIDVDIYTNDQLFTIEELQDTTFKDYCDGYFDENKTFVECEGTSIDDNQDYRYFGKTFELNDNMNTFQLRLKGEHDTYRFGSDFIESNSMSLIVEDDNIIFDYTDSSTKYKNTIFTKLPIIQIEEGVIKRYKKDDEPKGTYAYIMKIYSDEGSDSYSLDVTSHVTGIDSCVYNVGTIPTLMPPVLSGSGDTRIMKSRSRMIDPSKGYQMNGSVTKQYVSNGINKYIGSFGLRYCTDNVNGIPCFKIIGYEEKHIWDDKNISLPTLTGGDGYEYIIEIRNGRFLFNDGETNMTTALNFSYNKDSNHQRIYVTTFKSSENSTMYEYKIGDGVKPVKRFENGETYEYFVNGYDTDPSSVISYNNRKSIKVNHTGTYQVDAVLYDRFNNIFSKTSDTKVNVLPSYSNIKLYISERKSGDVDGSTGERSVVNTMLSSNKKYILGYVPKLRITGVIENGILNFAGSDTGDTYQDDGTVLSFNKTDYDMANISSLSDRIDPSMKDGNIYTFVKKSTHKSHLTPEDNKYGESVYDSKYTFKAIDDSGVSRSGVIDTDLNRCNAKSNSDITKGTLVDAYLCVYDDMQEKVVNKYICVYLQNKAYGNSPYDQYKVMIKDNIDISGYFDNKHSFYIIPRWNVKADSISIHGSNGENYVKINKDISSLYFCREIEKNSSEYVYYSKSGSNYYGFGLYKKIADGSNNCVEPFRCDNEYNSSVSKFSEFNIVKFSSGDITLQEYPCPIIKEGSDTNKQYVKLMDNDILKNVARFVDSQYSVSFRNFNPSDANEIWTESVSVNIKYEYTQPVKTSNSTVYAAPIVDKIYDSVSKLSESDTTVRWRVYRRVGLVERSMVIECYNKILSLKLPYYGKYDVEVDVFDKYGNKYTKEMGGAFTYTE